MCQNWNDAGKIRIIQGCRVLVRVGSCRARRVFEVLRFVPVRVKTRLRVVRFVSCVSEICLRVMHVGIRAPLYVVVCLCVSCVPRVTRVACHTCQKSCVSCVSRVMCVWIGCGSVRVRVKLLRSSGSCLFLRVLDNPCARMTCTNREV
jgi:hypothetical protein